MYPIYSNWYFVILSHVYRNKYPVHYYVSQYRQWWWGGEDLHEVVEQPKKFLNCIKRMEFYKQLSPFDDCKNYRLPPIVTTLLKQFTYFRVLLNVSISDLKSNQLWLFEIYINVDLIRCCFIFRLPRAQQQ